jgi:hypothetical protein
VEAGASAKETHPQRRMNFQEGMRRLALTVGAFGALTAAYFAYIGIEDLSSRRKSQAEFNSLMNLPLTQKITKQIAEEKLSNAVIDIKEARIQQMRLDENGQIQWFSMSDGKTIMRLDAPSAFRYFLYPLMVAVGFFAPWGAIRLFTWIVSGFISK